MPGNTADSHPCTRSDRRKAPLPVGCHASSLWGCVQRQRGSRPRQWSCRYTSASDQTVHQLQRLSRDHDRGQGEARTECLRRTNGLTRPSLRSETRRKALVANWPTYAGAHWHRAAAPVCVPQTRPGWQSRSPRATTRTPDGARAGSARPPTSHSARGSSQHRAPPPKAETIDWRTRSRSTSTTPPAVRHGRAGSADVALDRPRRLTAAHLTSRVPSIPCRASTFSETRSATAARIPVHPPAAATGCIRTNLAHSTIHTSPLSGAWFGRVASTHSNAPWSPGWLRRGQRPQRHQRPSVRRRPTARRRRSQKQMRPLGPTVPTETPPHPRELAPAPRSAARPATSPRAAEPIAQDGLMYVGTATRRQRE